MKTEKCKHKWAIGVEYLEEHIPGGICTLGRTISTLESVAVCKKCGKIEIRDKRTL